MLFRSDQRKKNKLRRFASNQGLRPTPTPNVSSQISQYPQEIIYGFSEDGLSNKLGYMGCGGVAVCKAITQQLLKDKLSFKDCIRKMSKHMILSSFFYRKEYNLAI